MSSIDPRLDDPRVVYEEFCKIIPPSEQRSIERAATMAHNNNPERAELHRRAAGYGGLK
jgi:hypothetical protein